MGALRGRHQRPQNSAHRTTMRFLTSAVSPERAYGDMRCASHRLYVSDVDAMVKSALVQFGVARRIRVWRFFNTLEDGSGDSSTSNAMVSVAGS